MVQLPWAVVAPVCPGEEVLRRDLVAVVVVVDVVAFFDGKVKFRDSHSLAWVP